jgi:PHD/YefM family antitoxin component YafN of YafNO toxin-antitoxin module
MPNIKENISVPVNRIISVTDFVRNFKEMNKKVEKDNINFLFKNNKPDKVIMTFDKYVELMEIINKIEDLECKSEIMKSELNDKKSHTVDEVFDNL